MLLSGRVLPEYFAEWYANFGDKNCAIFGGILHGVADGIEFEVWLNNDYQICRPVPSPNECVWFKGNGKPDSNKMTFEIFVLVNYDMSFTNK